MGIALKSASKKVQTATLCTSPSADGASPYNCGCSAAKTNLHNLGADSLDLAIALLEVGGSLTADYTLGDGKTGDSANFSIFKYNWFLIRTACTQFAGQQESDWNNGAVLNTDNGAAILCLRQQLAHYGDPWWGAQRDGSEGLSDSSATITQYKNGAQAIQNYLDQGHLTDDMAAYVEVPAI
ncbi:MAG: hypothetical protein M1828_003667 [Chrysothrix sp. TS-e1954]|nr:MAG: hypothetical protein M1828_003667 [Chrysothrix sp. TS-e1954]